MNMPFELGLDMGRRRSPDVSTNNKKFIIFERAPYDLKKCLSDLAGTDVQHHKNDFQLVLKHLRNFLVVEAGCSLPGASAIEGNYLTFQAWMLEKKLHEGHTEKEALELLTAERLTEMKAWMEAGLPSAFTAT